jgi:hypothetical protein
MPRGESPVESNGVECQSTIGEASVVLAVALRLERSQRVELSKGRGETTQQRDNLRQIVGDGPGGDRQNHPLVQAKDLNALCCSDDRSWRCVALLCGTIQAAAVMCCVSRDCQFGSPKVIMMPPRRIH